MSEEVKRKAAEHIAELRHMLDLLERDLRDDDTEGATLAAADIAATAAELNAII